MEQSGRRWGEIKEPGWSFWKEKTNYWHHRFRLASDGRKKWRRVARAYGVLIRPFLRYYNRMAGQRRRERKLKNIWKIYFLILTVEIMIFFIFK